MALLTEEDVRRMSNNGTRGPVVVNQGDVLTPSARSFLKEHRVETVYPQGQPEQDGTCTPEKAKYRTLFGAGLQEKPEHMTHLVGNVLVVKDHPRILFRGKLDSLQSAVVLAQVDIHERGGSQALIDDLGDILKILREMMRCDVLDEPFQMDTIIGLTHAELREQSHDPQRFFGVKAMVLPDYTMGRDFALLNQLRTDVRETEVAAASAFHTGAKYTRGDIIEELNRMSSAVHILMCRYLAGQYKTN